MSHQPEDYTIGWISALPIELEAAKASLDAVHPMIPRRKRDSNSYELGHIGHHNVVMTVLPIGDIGTNSAAIAANNMMFSFSSVEFIFMIGIGGGVPFPNDVRLGDVVVSVPGNQSRGVVQHDFGKIGDQGQFKHRGKLNGPPELLLSALNCLRASTSIQGDLSIHLSDMEQRDQQFGYPGAQYDLLFNASYEHVGGKGSCEKCDTSQLVTNRPVRESSTPIVHYAAIASGNQVIKHAGTRDDLANQHNIQCFDMEAAGLMNHFPCLVIRGISDYADSHKNKRWKAYAAATAVAFAKMLLKIIPPLEVEETGEEDLMAQSGLTESRTVLSIPQNLSYLGKQKLRQTQMSDGSGDFGVLRDKHVRLAPICGTTETITDQLGSEAGRIGDVVCPAHEESEEIYDFLSGEILENNLEWLLKDGKIGALMANERSKNRIFWLRGPPRCGKSCAAAFLIKHFREHTHPHGAVGYYFFNAARRTSAREAIHSIAYQLKIQIARPTVMLQASSSTHSHAPHRTLMGIRRLIKQELDYYLSKHTVNVYLIIDGLDEADFATTDPVSRKSEMKVFLGYLASLNSQRVKVLLISRPISVLEECIPNILWMNLTFKESCLSIERYVERFISDRPDIESMFFEAGIVPLKYFQDNANGVFTWAQNAVNQLSPIRSRARFRQCIDALPKDPTLLEDAYSRVLLNMNEDDADLAREIIYRLTASEGSMWLLRLKDVIEECTECTFDDSKETPEDIPQNSFTKFITIQCGSFLKVDLVGSFFKCDVVTFNHPSFLSFVSTERCRTDFLLDKKEFHTRDVLRALKLLFVDSETSKISRPQKWTDLLPNAAKSGDKATQVLIYIYRLFNSVNVLFRWFREMLQTNEWFNGLPMSSILLQDNPAMQIAAKNIIHWASGCEINSTDKTAAAEVDRNELQSAFEFLHKLSDPSYLYNRFAILAAYGALYDNCPLLCTPMQLKLMFACAFRYYCKYKQECIADVLQDLIKNELRGMVEWLGLSNSPRSSCLGYIFFFLQEWQLSTGHYRKGFRDGEDNYYLRLQLAEVYETEGKYLDAVEEYKEAIKYGYSYHHGCADAARTFHKVQDSVGFSKFVEDMRLDNTLDSPSYYDNKMVSAMSVYMSGGDYRNAIRSFREPEDLKMLLKAYEAIDYDDDGIIKDLRDMLERWDDIYEPDLLNSLYRAYLAKEDIKGALNTLHTAIKIKSHSRHFKMALADVHVKDGNIDEAITLLKESLLDYPTTVDLWTKLFQLLISVRRYDELEDCYHQLYKTTALKRTSSWFPCLRQGCMAMGQALEERALLSEAIKIYEEALKTNAAFKKLWKHLCDFYEVKRIPSTAVKIIRSMLQKMGDDRVDTSQSRKKEFLADFLSDQINGTVEQFALWYGLNCVWVTIQGESGETVPRDSSGWTPLHIIAHEGHEEMVDLIAITQYLHEKDHMGCTPLHLAAKNGHLAVVRRLLHAGADPEARDLLGFTALNSAVEYGKWDVVEVLRKLYNIT